MLFDTYLPEKFSPSFGLMLLIEIHREEMAWAMENNSAALIERLKQADVYPYSNIDRPTVV